MAPANSSGFDILLLGSDLAENCRAFLEKLGATCRVATTVEELGKRLHAKTYPILIASLEPRGSGLQAFDIARNIQPTCQGIAICPGPWESAFQEITRADYPHHFISSIPDLREGDLAITVEKIRSGDIFGLERYDIPVQESIEVGEGEGRYPHISKAVEFFLRQGVPARQAERAEMVIHELVTNARKAKVRHGGEVGRVRLEYGVGGSRFGASVSDSWGELESRSLFSSINRAIQERSVLDQPGRGAGIGLLMSFKATNSLIFNVSPGCRTEGIAIFHRQESSGKSLKMGHSLHYFRGGPS